MNNTFNSEYFAELYDSYFNKCYLFTKSYVHDKHVAEDITSESLIKLYEILQREEIKNISAYLMTLLRNKSLDHLRHLAAREKAYSNLSTIDSQELAFRISTLEECDPDIIFSKEIQSIINKTLSDLSSQTRKIYLLSRNENYTNKEIASEMDLSVKSVEYHMTKALSALRVNLKDYLPSVIILFFF